MILDCSLNFFVAIFVILSLVYYKYFFGTSNRLEKLGVKFDRNLPFFGSIFSVATNRKHAYMDQKEAYDRFENERYFVRFVFKRPVLVIRDPSLISKILSTDFNHFHDKSLSYDTKLDRLSKHLVNLGGEQWNVLRRRITPVFTSSKLRSMHEGLIDCCDLLSGVMDKFVRSHQPFDTKVTMAKFTMDVIGRCAFGLNVNSLEDPRCEFRKMGEAVFNPTFIGRMRFVVRLLCPELLRLLRWKALAKDVEDFFVNLVKDLIRDRTFGQTEKRDFIQLMVNLRNQLPKDGLNSSDDCKFYLDLLI